MRNSLESQEKSLMVECEWCGQLVGKEDIAAQIYHAYKHGASSDDDAKVIARMIFKEE